MVDVSVLKKKSSLPSRLHNIKCIYIHTQITITNWRQVEGSQQIHALRSLLSGNAFNNCWRSSCARLLLQVCEILLHIHLSDQNACVNHFERKLQNILRRNDIESDIITPEYGKLNCFMNPEYALLPYLYGPIGVLLLCNLIFFSFTIYDMYKIQQSTKFASMSSSKNPKQKQS